MRRKAGQQVHDDGGDVVYEIEAESNDNSAWNVSKMDGFGGHPKLSTGRVS